MWFVFGVITLSGFIYGFIVFRRTIRWKPLEGTLRGGRRYLWSESRHKGKRHSARIGLPVSTDLHFTLKRESLIDRAFKWLGLSVEQELNQLHFDQNIYVVSDDKRLGRILKTNESLAGQLAYLFERQSMSGWRIKSLGCNGTCLFVEVKPTKVLPRELPLSALAVNVLPALESFAAALAKEASDNSGKSARKDHFILKAAILVGTSTGLAVHALINIARLTLIDDFNVIDDEALFRLALITGGLVTAGLLAACIYMLGRTSRMHLVFVELLTIGFAGAIGAAWVELRDGNIYLDTNPGQQEIVTVQQTHTYRCGRRNRSTCYSVRFGPSQFFPKGFSESVSAATFRNYSEGDRALLTIRPGYLGFRWVDLPAPLPKQGL